MADVLQYESLIPPIYPDAFPEGFVLRPAGWALTDDVIFRGNVSYKTPANTQIDIRPISTLDVGFLSNALIERIRKDEISIANHYPCGNKCPGCFSEDDVYADAGNLMTWQETFAVIDQARAIGLKTIKFLGPGEVFNNPDLFDILDAAEERGLEFSIFTKGAELGSDELAKMNFGCSAKELVQRLAQYKCVRILLGFNSFNSARQDKLVGAFNKQTNYRIENGLFVDRGVANYTQVRNQALRNLVEAGFNAPERGQRLSLICAPVQLYQDDEIADMYEWAARRNMPLVIAPTMDSGPKAKLLTLSTRHKDPDHGVFQNLNMLVYKRAFEIGVLTKEQIQKEGISAYIGTKSCTQVANGLFMRLNGRIQICTGTTRSSTIYGNVHETTIAEIRRNSPNYRMGASANNGCPAKTQMMPADVMRDIQAAVLAL